MLPHHQKSVTPAQNRVPIEPVAKALEIKLQRNIGIVIGLGIALVLVGFLGWLSVSQTYGTLENFFIASGYDPTEYYLFKDLTNLIAIYLTFIATGTVALFLGVLSLKSFKVRNLFVAGRPNARLGNGLIGGGGALVFGSLRSFFVYVLSSDFFELKFFIVMFSVGVLLIAFGILALRRKS